MVEHSDAVQILRDAESPVSITVLREVTDQDQIDIALSVSSTLKHILQHTPVEWDCKPR